MKTDTVLCCCNRLVSLVSYSTLLRHWHIRYFAARSTLLKLLDLVKNHLIGIVAVIDDDPLNLIPRIVCGQNIDEGEIDEISAIIRDG